MRQKSMAKRWVGWLLVALCAWPAGLGAQCRFLPIDSLPLPHEVPVLAEPVWCNEPCRLWVDSVMQSMSLKERIGQRIETELAEFKTDFLERHLCSDPDDDIRKTTLELITEKAQLSKLHTKYAKIESDYDRLSELVPQSLLVWKDAILDLQIKHIRAKINDSANSPEDTENLMKQISELQQLRSRLAKHMGERVIIP